MQTNGNVHFLSDRNGRSTEKRSANGRFVKGWSGGPGRPRYARNGHTFELIKLINKCLCENSFVEIEVLKLWSKRYENNKRKWTTLGKLGRLRKR